MFNQPSANPTVSATGLKRPTLTVGEIIAEIEDRAQAKAFADTIPFRHLWVLAREADNPVWRAFAINYMMLNASPNDRALWAKLSTFVLNELHSKRRLTGSVLRTFCARSPDGEVKTVAQELLAEFEAQTTTPRATPKAKARAKKASAPAKTEPSVAKKGPSEPTGKVKSKKAKAKKKVVADSVSPVTDKPGRKTSLHLGDPEAAAAMLACCKEKGFGDQPAPAFVQKESIAA